MSAASKPGSVPDCSDCRDIGFIYEPDGPAYPCPKCDASLKVAGRFVLLHGPHDDPYYITSWDTWEECKVAFPIEGDSRLFDQDTGRMWDRHSKYEWEAAAT